MKMFHVSSWVRSRLVRIVELLFSTGYYYVITTNEGIDRTATGPFFVQNYCLISHLN